jgi:PEP-CTERM motif
MQFKTKKSLVLAAMVGAFFSASSHAALGDDLIATGGNITITFLGSDADFDSLISVNGGPKIFPNHSTAPNTTFDLGSFAAGTLLDIALSVVTPGAENTFHTGSGANNADGMPHADVIYNYLGTPGLTYVGFEDTLGGGDKDYNDHQFAFTMIAAAVPEPETYALMLAGLGAVGFLARRRKQQA